MYYQQPPPAYYGPRYSGCLKFVLYALSFFIPIVGIIAGIIYMSKGDPESSALGKACLFIAIAAIVIGCCVGAGFTAFSVLSQQGSYSY
jgi:hypothetical protein